MSAMKLQGWQVAGKAWTGLIGSLLTFIVPWVVQTSAGFPQPWPALVGAVVALMTAFGVYNAPYQPVSNAGVPQSGPSDNPWPK
jgi:hypothetical protein